ncbi:MAG: intradiol ring-cleavage dioxygenase [Nitrospira sp.]|nr:intradiol ring-cleavage dioxygenase [Nitrospira sp.]
MTGAFIGVLSRREALVWLGTTSLAYLLGRGRAEAHTLTSLPRSPCIVRPEQTEGPYFVDERLYRSDIRVDPTNGRRTAGTPLMLTFQMSRLRAGECHPLPDAQVDIWHCDAAGVYSDVRDPGFSTLGQKFLRGYQTTDARGEARFLTIYPGWYPIRTVHIHVKIRTAPTARRGLEFTSQVYFPDEVTDHVQASQPYAAMGPRRVRNHQDFIFRHGGDQLMLDPVATNDGYAATFPIALEYS